MHFRHSQLESERLLGVDNQQSILSRHSIENVGEFIVE